MIRQGLAFLTITLAASAVAQLALKKLAYEVVSVKVVKDSNPVTAMQLRGPGGRLSIKRATLTTMINIAFSGAGLGGSSSSFGNPEIRGLPGWAQTERFEVEARPAANFVPDSQQVGEMLRNLLEERFALRVHTEAKEGTVFHLVMSKAGIARPGLKRSEDQTQCAGRLPDGRICGMVRAGASAYRGHRMTMADLARTLVTMAGRPVIDKTGLDGRYDVEFSYAPDAPPGAGDGGLASEPAWPALFTALQEQLGLRLEAATEPIPFLVVDRVERPVEN